MPPSRPVIVIGHKNPDTDSICSALTYAELQRQRGVRARACRAGSLNDQTAFVLRHFGVKAPRLLTDVYPKISDIMIQGKDLLVLSEHDTIARAQGLLVANEFTFLPVATPGGLCAGKVTAVRVAKVSQELLEEDTLVTLEVADAVGLLGARVLAGQRSGARGGRVQLLSAGAAPTGAAQIVVTDTSDRGMRAALARKPSLIVACGPGTVARQWKDAVRTQSRERELTLLATSKSQMQAYVGLHLAQPIGPILDRDHPTFNDHALVRDVQAEVARYNYGGFIIIDDVGRISGVVARDTFLRENRFQVILVDHNELGQSVDGMQEADVIEVVDHHRLDARATDAPIVFTNRIVGSTATIIATEFHAAGKEPARKYAGLMLAAILSDTVILRSPTTTATDREMAKWLSRLCGEKIAAFGEAMFAAGSSLRDLSDDEILERDRKEFGEGDVRFAISQVEGLGFKEVHARLGSLMEALRRQAAGAIDFACLVATDITAESSLLLFQGDARIRDAITYPRVEGGAFEMKDVLSRKKQVLPYFLDLIRRV